MHFLNVLIYFTFLLFYKNFLRIPYFFRRIKKKVEIMQSSIEQQAISLIDRKKRLSKAKMREYLLNPNEYDTVLTILHTKVVQKSYKAEKRFFCPPPCVVLSGNGWRRREQALDAHGTVAARDHFYATIGIGKPSIQKEEALKFTEERLSEDWSRWDVKSLYIASEDKRKYIDLTVSCFYDIPTQQPPPPPGNNGNGGPSVATSRNGGRFENIGCFDSRRIKVISKPSKKKQSMKTPDTKNLGICISSGTEVALFSRARSQSANTRYLFVDGNDFTANSKRWGTFTINLVDEEDFVRKVDGEVIRESGSWVDGFINYGSVVKLTDSATGMSLPRMRIHKVDKNMLISQCEEPVSQLRKCAFEVLDNSGGHDFLCFNNDRIVQQHATDNAKTVAGDMPICENAQWTIISTDTTEYRFYEAMGPCIVTPVPNIQYINIEASESHLAYMELIGCNFIPFLSVWLGWTEVPTIYLNPERLRCPMPPLLDLLAVDDTTENGADRSCCQQIIRGWKEPQQAEEGGEEYQIPVSLVRDDGVIYASRVFVRYPAPSAQALAAEHQPPPAKVSKVEYYC